MRPYPLPARSTIGSGFVEWDDTPSFAQSLPDRLNWRERTHAFATPGTEVYADTMPADLLPETVPSAFSEPVEGLAVREVNDLDVFRHFFAV